MMEFIVMYILK